MHFRMSYVFVSKHADPEKPSSAEDGVIRYSQTSEFEYRKRIQGIVLERQNYHYVIKTHGGHYPLLDYDYEVTASDSEFVTERVSTAVTVEERNVVTEPADDEDATSLPSVGVVTEGTAPRQLSCA